MWVIFVSTIGVNYKSDECKMMWTRTWHYGRRIKMSGAGGGWKMMIRSESVKGERA